MTDTNAGPVLPEPAPITGSEAQALRERVAELEREEEVTDHVIERTTRLLAECVVILRGPEPPLTKWSYHDIPQLVQALKDDRDRLRAECEALSKVLDTYEAQTKALPGQHEIPQRGCSTYNWRMACIRDLRSMIDAARAARGEG